MRAMNEMNNQKPEKIEKPEELLRAEKLIDDAKVNEAHELLNNFEKRESLTLQDKVASQLLRADLLFQQGRYRESLTLAEETYKESLGLGKNLQSVDAIIHMANSLWLLVKIDKLFDVIIQGEELLKNLPQVLSSKRMKREAYLVLLKGMFYLYSGKTNLVSNCLKQSQDLIEKFDFKRLNATILWLIAYGYSNNGDLDLAFVHIKKGVAIAKESKNKYTIANCLYVLGGIYHLIGDWERALKIFKECSSIYEELDNRKKMSNSLNSIAEIYRDFTEDYDSASDYIETSLVVYNEDVNFLWAGTRFYTAITIGLKKGDYEEAKKYLQNLKQMNSQVKNKFVDFWYRISKAIVLKSSSRFHDMAKAEEILRQIVAEDTFFFFMNIKKVALINLYDILLAEFRVTNNLEILNELESLITHLLILAEKTQSHSIRAETYLFQAKLALLSFDVKKSRRFLTQAQQIAKRHNLNKLAREISSEHKNLIDSLELWEQLRDSEAPLSERFELAQISEQMKRMHRAQVVVTQITEEKVAITKEKKICLVCRGEVLRFSYICECGAMYCNNCARALSNLENVCWSCEYPIDYSKPSKPYKEEEKLFKVPKKSKKAKKQ
jgi:tetratricopeptide (TPR) repeat protein